MDGNVRRFDRAGLRQLHCTCTCAVETSYIAIHFILLRDCSISALTPFVCRSNEPLPDYSDIWQYHKTQVLQHNTILLHTCSPFPHPPALLALFLSILHTRFFSPCLSPSLPFPPSLPSLPFPPFPSLPSSHFPSPNPPVCTISYSSTPCPTRRCSLPFWML